MNLKTWLLTMAGLLAAGAAQAAEVEAKKDGVEIFAEATNKSEVVGKLGKGDALEAIERKGMFWQVKLKEGDKKGFVSVLSVAHKAGDNTSLSKAIKEVVKDGRSSDEQSEGRARSSVMGVRGLREDDNAGNAGNVRPNLRAVYSMEDVRVPKKKVEDLGTSVLDEISKKAEKGETGGSEGEPKKSKHKHHEDESNAAEDDKSED